MPDYDGFDESSYIGPWYYIGSLVVVLVVSLVILALLDVIGKRLDIKFIKFLSQAAFEGGKKSGAIFLFLISMFLARGDWLLLTYILTLGCLFWGLETWRMIELDEGNERHISYGAIAICGIIGLLFISFAR